MFTLPQGTPVEGAISVEAGAIQSFDHGVIIAFVALVHIPVAFPFIGRNLHDRSGVHGALFF